MNKLFLCGLLATTMLFSCEKGEAFDEYAPKKEQQTEGGGVYLNLSATIEPRKPADPRKPVDLRVTKTTFIPGDVMGLFYDEYANEKLSYNGTKWGGREVALSKEPKDIHCYFPYQSSITDGKAIPINIDQQTDLLVGTANVKAGNTKTEVKMKHALSLVRIVIEKGSYTGRGYVESVLINGIDKSAEYDILSNSFAPKGEKGSIQVNAGHATPLTTETIVLPVTSTAGISVNIVVDGKVREHKLEAEQSWEQSRVQTYTFSLQEVYNSPVELPEYRIDYDFWRTYGKADKIVLGNSGEDWYSIRWATKTGRSLYRNEGSELGVMAYWMGMNLEAGEMPEKWEGEMRFVLMDDAGNIVEQFQPFIPTGKENGTMMKATYQRAFITAPVGTYELGALFKKKGTDYWQKADRYDGFTEKDMQFFVKENANAPAIQMIQVGDEYNSGVVVHDRSFGESFEITYLLSNKEQKRLKGEIKAVWERTFAYNGNCYSPGSRRPSGANDNEWEDEIGRIYIDVQPTVRHWKGSIRCKFPQKRENTQDVDGRFYCTPMLHLYWREEGSNDWELLRVDGDPLLVPDKENPSLCESALNYVSLGQSHWFNN